MTLGSSTVEPKLLKRCCLLEMCPHWSALTGVWSKRVAGGV
jgi:hypothetical protein